MRTRGGLNPSSGGFAESALLDLYEQRTGHRPSARTLERLVEHGVHDRLKLGRTGRRGGRGPGVFAPAQFEIAQLLCDRWLMPGGTFAARAELALGAWLSGVDLAPAQVRRAYRTCRQSTGRSRAATARYGRMLADWYAGGSEQLDRLERARFSRAFQALLAGDSAAATEVFDDPAYATAPFRVSSGSDPLAGKLRGVLAKLRGGELGPGALSYVLAVIAAAPEEPADQALELARALHAYAVVGFGPMIRGYLTREPIVAPERRPFEMLTLVLGAGALLNGNDTLLDSLIALLGHDRAPAPELQLARSAERAA